MVGEKDSSMAESNCTVFAQFYVIAWSTIYVLYKIMYKEE